MKKSVLIPYILLAIALVTAIVGFYQASSVRNSLKTLQQDQKTVEAKLRGYEAISATDSLLLAGQYDSALRSYQEQQQLGDGILFQNIELKMALVNKLKRSSLARDTAMDKTALLDSLLPNTLPLAREIRAYDSLSFAHEKIKVQLSRLRKQLQQKAYGEYLTFKSKKGNTMHYVGQVKNGKANGNGIALLDTGSRYEGQWQDNQRHGEGTFYWVDGEYYMGTYQKDRRHGMGTYYWPNGEKYVGLWKDDKRNGKGEFFAKDGSLLTSGVWKNDKLVEANKKEQKSRR